MNIDVARGGASGEWSGDEPGLFLRHFAQINDVNRGMFHIMRFPERRGGWKRWRDVVNTVATVAVKEMWVAISETGRHFKENDVLNTL